MQNSFPRLNGLSLLKRRNFFEKYAQDHSFDFLSAEGWYSQSQTKILSTKGAASIVSYHNHSVSQALVDLFPEVGLEQSGFKSKKWHSRKARRALFENYAKESQFDYLSPSAWYSQTYSKILSFKGVSGVLHHYNYSLSSALIDLFPNIGLQERRFKYKKKEGREVFENYARKNGFDYLSPAAWYSQPYLKIFRGQGTKGVLLQYKNNIPKALMELFPEIGLEKSKFKTFTRWQFAKNRKLFFDNFSKSRNFDPLVLANWYKAPVADVLETKAGRSILAYFDNSFVKAITKTYPSITIDKQKFETAQKKLARRKEKRKGVVPNTPKSDSLTTDLADFAHKKWYSRKERRTFFENYALFNGFDYLSPDAWYSQPYLKLVSFKKIARVLKYYKNSVSEALLDLFPEIGLEKSQFKSYLMQASSFPLKPEIVSQGYLEEVVVDLFLPERVIYDTRKKSQVTNPNTGHFFEIDVWVPNLQLGFEFQDVYHYMNTWYSQSTLDTVQQIDASKRNTVKQAGITLVQVPCWWNATPESLVSTIQFERPDLLVGVNSEDPVPLNPEDKFFDLKELPEVGGLMLASFPLNPNFAHLVVGNTWWMGEKYDGMRCCWNPMRQIVYSRSGKKVPLPPAFIASLPSIFTDGEFWFGRGRYSLIIPLLHGEAAWSELRVISFDVPFYLYHQISFEMRYKFLLNVTLLDHPINIVAPRILCEGGIHLNSIIAKVIDEEGEGVIMQRVGSSYEQGRNKNLIKLKNSYGDTEGLVVGVDTSAVTLKLSNGKILKVPLQHCHILSPHAGEVVTFSYEKLANRRASPQAEIVRRREDLKWEDVIANSHQHHILEEAQGENLAVQPRGFWTFGNMREYLVSFAKNLYLDPLLPSTWSKIPFDSIADTKAGKAILRKFKDPFAALTALFPEIDHQSFDNLKKGPKSTTLKRRQFFEKYAKENKFDFLSPGAWYSQARSKIAYAAKIANVLQYHNHSVSRALMDLFPDIGLEKTKFKGSRL